MSVLTVNSGQARSNFRDLLDRVFVGSDDVMIERNGKPVAVMIPVNDYQDLFNELDDLRATRRALANYEAWQTDASLARPFSAVEKDLIDDGLLDE